MPKHENTKAYKREIMYTRFAACTAPGPRPPTPGAARDPGCYPRAPEGGSIAPHLRATARNAGRFVRRSSHLGKG